MTALLLTTCGRGHYLSRCLASLDTEPFEHRIVVDDSGDLDYARKLRLELPGWTIISHAARRGLAAAIETGWDAIRHLDVDYVFHVEDDFVFPDPIPLDRMRQILEDDPTLAQVVLYRQPGPPHEVAHGGYLNMGEYEQTGDLYIADRCFSFNPCLYPAWVCDHDGGLEADVTAQLVSEHKRFAVLAGPDKTPLCFHIGAERSAGWQLFA
jgi:glycosyltransferase involved in cell wall biosynthesis